MKMNPLMILIPVIAGYFFGWPGVVFAVLFNVAVVIDDRRNYEN